MRAVEKLCLGLRHSKYLDQASWAWDIIRPVYDRMVSLAGRRGLERVMNGPDSDQP
jgi:hypothetical protein